MKATVWDWGLPNIGLSRHASTSSAASSSLLRRGLWQRTALLLCAVASAQTFRVPGTISFGGDSPTVAECDIAISACVSRAGGFKDRAPGWGGHRECNSVLSMLFQRRQSLHLRGGGRERGGSKGRSRMASTNDSFEDGGGSDEMSGWDDERRGEDSNEEAEDEDQPRTRRDGSKDARPGKNKKEDSEFEKRMKKKIQQFNNKFGVKPITPAQGFFEDSKQLDTKSKLRKLQDEEKAAEDEMKELQKQLTKEYNKRPTRRKEPEELEEMKQRVRELKQRLGETKRKTKDCTLKLEYNAEQKRRVMEGKKPYFVRDITRKSDKKKFRWHDKAESKDTTSPPRAVARS